MFAILCLIQKKGIICKSLCLLKFFAHNQLCAGTYVWQPTFQQRLWITCKRMGLIYNKHLDLTVLQAAPNGALIGVVLWFTTDGAAPNGALVNSMFIDLLIINTIMCVSQKVK